MISIRTSSSPTWFFSTLGDFFSDDCKTIMTYFCLLGGGTHSQAFINNILLIIDSKKKNLKRKKILHISRISLVKVKKCGKYMV